MIGRFGHLGRKISRQLANNWRVLGSVIWRPPVRCAPSLLSFSLFLLRFLSVSRSRSQCSYSPASCRICTPLLTYGTYRVGAETRKGMRQPWADEIATSIREHMCQSQARTGRVSIWQSHGEDAPARLMSHMRFGNHHDLASSRTALSSISVASVDYTQSCHSFAPGLFRLDASAGASKT